MRSSGITAGAKLIRVAVQAALLWVWASLAAAHCRLPILVYHRFAATAADSMTVRTDRFAAQLDYLAGHGYMVVPLHQAVACLRGEAVALPPKALAITVDDGHRSVYTDMLPLVRQRRIPVTLFIYPSAISNAAYALTWEQLAAAARQRAVRGAVTQLLAPEFQTGATAVDARAISGTGEDATGKIAQRHCRPLGHASRPAGVAVRHLRPRT